MAEEQPLPMTELFPKSKKSTLAAEPASPPAGPVPAASEKAIAAPEPPTPPSTTEAPAGDADEPKKRRGRPAGGGTRKGKGAGEEVLFLVETEAESGQYASEEIPTTLQLLDILDSGRQIIATRSWRQF